MLARLRTRAHEAEGFTLIELLIVVVILGILATIVVFAVGTTTDNAKSSACKTDVSTAQTGVDAYKAQTGNFPADLTTLTSKDAQGNGPWLRSAPTDVSYDSTTGAVTPKC
jgi:general secretion pathway protein G